MCKVKAQGHIVGLTVYRLTSLCSTSVGPPILGIVISQFDLKVHGQDHSSRSHSGFNILLTHIPFVPCQSTPKFLLFLWSQWANGGGGLQSPTSQHGGHQNRRTRQGLVWCIIIITHSHKCTHRLKWVGGIVSQKIAIYNALILSHGHFVFSAGGGGLNAVRWRTRYVWASEVEDCNFRYTPR